MVKEAGSPVVGAPDDKSETWDWAESPTSGALGGLAEQPEVFQTSGTIVQQIFTFFPQTVETTLTALHQWTGMPYWGVIVASTITLRLLTFPLVC